MQGKQCINNLCAAETRRMTGEFPRGRWKMETDREVEAGDGG